MRTVLIAVGAGSLLCGIPAILLVIRCRRRRARSVGPMPADERGVATRGVSCDVRRYEAAYRPTSKSSLGQTDLEDQRPKPLTSAPPGTRRSSVTDAVGLAPSLLPRLGAVAISHATTALEP